MAKIIWQGFTRRIIPAPCQPLPTDARPLIVPRRHFWLKAILLAAPVYLPVLVSLYLKNEFLQTDMRNKPWILADMALALLLGPLHECLHAWAYPKEATAHIGVLYRRCLFYMDCGAPIRRGHYFVMCLLPVLLCLIPWTVFLLCPADAKALASLCWGCAIMCAVGPCPDYMNAWCAWRQVPRGGILQEGEDGGDYWYVTTTPPSPPRPHPTKQECPTP